MNPELLSKLSLVRSANPSWDFDRSFQYLMAQEKQGTFGRPTKSADAVLVAEANGIKDPEPPKTVAATVPKAKGVLVTGGFYNLLPGMTEDEE